jgi:ABC-type uncharacterized transport system fused permease/ATPase subunit
MNDGTSPTVTAAQADDAPSDSDDMSSSANGDLRRRYLLRRFWNSASGFWGRGGKRSAWLLTSAIFLIILPNLATLYGINIWNRGIFDALEKRNSARVFELALIYFPLLHQVAFAPLMFVAVPRLQLVGEQEGQDLITFHGIHIVDPHRVAGVGIQHLAARDRMGEKDWMRDRRLRRALLRRQRSALAAAPAAHHLPKLVEVMHGGGI